MICSHCSVVTGGNSERKLSVAMSIYFRETRQFRKELQTVSLLWTSDEQKIPLCRGNPCAEPSRSAGSLTRALHQRRAGHPSREMRRGPSHLVRHFYRSSS